MPRDSGHYFDKMPTGFLTWTKTVKGYKPITGHTSPFVWDKESQPALDILESTLLQPENLKKLILLWSQETGKGTGNLDIRMENVCLVKSAGRQFYPLERFYLIF